MHNLQISLLANWALVLSIIREFISTLCVRSLSFVLNMYSNEFSINVSLLIYSFALQVHQIKKVIFCLFYVCLCLGAQFQVLV